MKGLFRFVAIIILAYSMSVVGAEHAADPPPTCKLSIDSQSLDAALQEMARQCDVQMIYFSEITAGLTVRGLTGQYAIDDALHLLLDNTGLSFRHVNPQTIEIQGSAAANPAVTARRGPSKGKPTGARPVPPPENASELAEVVINTTGEGLVATRIETPLRDIPQTYSVLSGEQMRQQNDFEVEDVMDNAVGITSVRQNSLYQSYFSRGFILDTFSLDGGGALQAFSQPVLIGGPQFLTPDLSEFDHVELLRGANALFGADALPGGAVNLVHKRPLDTPTVMFTSSAGSWNNYRQEVDATGPLGLDDALRGRVDVTYANRQYFFDYARDERKSVFGVLDCDLTPGTLLTVGASYRWDRATPFQVGLSLLSNGVDPRLARNTSYTFAWSRNETQMREGYVHLVQALGGAWQVKVNATVLDASVGFAYGSFITPIDPATGGFPLPPYALYTAGPVDQRQLNLEATLTGTMQWWGHRADFAFGGDFLRAHANILQGETGLFGPPLANAGHFDPAAYPDPRNGPTAGVSYGDNPSSILAGLFASLRVQLTQPWFVTAGLRVSNERITDNSVYYFSGGLSFPVPLEYESIGKVTPFVGTVVALNNNYSLYASYADIYQSNRGFTDINGRPLRPADGVDMEAGVKAAWRDGTLNGSLAVYKTVERGIGLADPNVVPTSPWCCYWPNGRNLSRGVDLELSGHITAHWLIGGGYTLNHNAQVVPGQALSSSLYEQTPHHLLKLWTSWNLPGAWYRWSIGATVRAQSSNFLDTAGCSVEDAQGNCLGQYAPIQVIQKSYAVVSPRFGYQFDRHWQVGLSINNVFDRRYYQTIGQPDGGNWYGEPRNFLLRLDGRY